ncbi:HAD family hydrolase [Sabulicella rubraurantiaca]|uniref:HAD family hydrolase n=1 Tax=Sabulicella rubraurantiaca TaxID=2811429 RepID=UPI001A9608F7|nr:HAD family phosphatase [Sabulicella rubraurantiaca]
MIRAVLFDCDGVLADSERLINEIVARELTSRGWAMTAEEAEHEFLGIALPDMIPRIERCTGPLPQGWTQSLSREIQAEIARSLGPIPGAADSLALLAARGMTMAVCSNSSRIELRLKLETLGFLRFFEGRVLSFQDVGHPKPAPDLYLRAAALCGEAPEHCLVVEDSDAGEAAGRAAGCPVLRVRGHLDPETLARRIGEAAKDTATSSLR